jgi:predicted O-linked N-acetylglucosamine transferase (SPINDLY family)
MAGALLTAAGLTSLITHTLSAYEEKAVQLANSPDEVARLKAQLNKVKADGVLFDTPRFVRNLESRLAELIAA